jgi:hypothetical protein
MDTEPAFRDQQETPREAGGKTLSNVRGTPFFELFDGLLRRRESYFEAIFQGKEVGALIRWCLLATIFLSALYGLTMGAASFTSVGWGTGFAQSLSSAVKVPLLYLLSLLVCYPVLYFVIVLMGSRLSFSQTLALILLAVTMNAILLAGCSPIILFFAFTGSDYVFIKLLNVGFFVFSGAWAMMALWQGLMGMCEKSDLYPKKAVRVLQIWILVFGFVGTQMAWSLRPFIGDPGKKFEIVRADQSGNIYFHVWRSITGIAKGAIDEKSDEPPADPSDP